MNGKKIRLYGIYCIVFFIAMISFSCRTNKKIVETPNATVKLKGAEVIQVFDSVLSHQFKFEFLSAKANVDYTDKTGDNTGFDVNLRMKKDSLIWLSITPLLGIEAARLLITTDSVYVLDRVHKTIMKRDFRYFEDQLKTAMNFEMLQAVIVGNYFQYQKNEKLKSIYEEEPFVILSSLNKRQIRRSMEEKDPSKPVVQDFWIDGNYKIARSRITDNRQDRTVDAAYKNFTEYNGSLIPNNIEMTIVSSAPTRIKVEYNKISASDSLSFPFNIPEKYEHK